MDPDLPRSSVHQETFGDENGKGKGAPEFGGSCQARQNSRNRGRFQRQVEDAFRTASHKPPSRCVLWFGKVLVVNEHGEQEFARPDAR